MAIASEHAAPCGDSSKAPRAHYAPNVPTQPVSKCACARGNKQSSRLNKLSQNNTYCASNLVEDVEVRVLSVEDSQVSSE